MDPKAEAEHGVGSVESEDRRAVRLDEKGKRKHETTYTVGQLGVIYQSGSNDQSFERGDGVVRRGSMLRGTGY